MYLASMVSTCRRILSIGFWFPRDAAAAMKASAMGRPSRKIKMARIGMAKSQTVLSATYAAEAAPRSNIWVMVSR
jgi:hypothetical protein